MKKPFSLTTSLFLILTTLFFFLSCKKINEATLLGGGLVPEVDNINTFEKSFDTETDNVLLADTAKLTYGDAVALGAITNDPEFGQTTASVYFQVNPAAYGKYPFTEKNPQIDSVVLSLDYVSSYGDINATQTVRVYEIAQSASFNDTTFYPFDQPALETTGVELGSAAFTMSQLKDSVSIIRKDTVKVANQLRIRLDPALGSRFAAYDTTSGANGGYYNDTIFKTLFRGFAIKADEGTGNGLAYFDLTNTSNTGLTIYYKTEKEGKFDTAEAVFTHALRNTYGNRSSTGGQANIIRRQPGGGWAAYVADGDPTDEKLYIQSTPGSAGYVKIPGLDTFKNKLIHRAELIATRIPSALDNFFTAPEQLFADKMNANSNKDSAFIFNEFIIPSSTGLQFDFASFGGHLRTDNTYRFNVTTTVQDIIAHDSSNFKLRIYAPFDTRPYNTRTFPATPTFVQAIPYIAYGRVVLAGGNYAEAGMKLRLRVIYSNL